MCPDAQDPGPVPGPATALLDRIAAGDAEAGRRLYEVLHGELHRMAHRAMADQGSGHTLQATALVNEAWLRLIGSSGDSWQSRRHFFDVAAKAMRSVLVDYARRRGRQKRGGGARPAPLAEIVDLYAERAFDLVELDDALERLAREDERLARVVELRFFAGLTIDQAAEVLGLGHATVERDWHVARTWLRHELRGA